MFSSLQLVISTGGGEEGSVVAQIIGAHRRHRRQRDVALPAPLHPSLRFLPSLHLPRSDWRRSFLVACARTCVEYGRAYTMHRRLLSSWNPNLLFFQRVSRLRCKMPRGLRIDLLDERTAKNTSGKLSSTSCVYN